LYIIFATRERTVGRPWADAYVLAVGAFLSYCLCVGGLGNECNWD